MPLEAARYCIPSGILKLTRHSDAWWFRYNMRKRSQSGSKFTGESAYVVPTVQSCLECTSFGPVIKYDPLHPILTHQAMDLQGLDYIGPLPETPAENKYILNAIDYFTRFGWAWPMKAATEEPLSERLV
jgi:hypothetical protein